MGIPMYLPLEHTMLVEHANLRAPKLVEMFATAVDV